MATLTAGDIMQRDVVTVPATMRLTDLERYLLENKVTGAPVVDAAELQGVVSRSDIVRRLVVERSVAECLVDYQRDAGQLGGAGAAEQSKLITTSAAGNLAELTVADVMTHDVVTADRSAPLEELARTMVEHHIHRVLITDDGRLEGIVTSIDLMRCLAERGGA